MGDQIEGEGPMIRTCCRAAVFFLAVIAVAAPAIAHHGGGTFDGRRAVTLTGKLTRIDFINPHSWIYFDVTGPDGKVSSYRCETRSAHTLRRSGWTKEMFRLGQRITIEGSPDSKDPNSCYLNTIVLEDGTRMDRYGQYVKAPAGGIRPVPGPIAVASKPRPPRTQSGQPNISGDWAPEQLVMTDPRGRGGALVPLSRVGEFKPGEGRIGGPAGARGAGPRRFGGTELTEAGEKIASTFEVYSPVQNPRLRCETTSIIFDWTFDGPVNRITQNRDTIVIQYGQLGLKRTIHMNIKQHPANVKPSRAGHSIGRWEDDVLIVDTIGFLPGVLSPPVMNSDRLHVVERFSLDPKTLILTRSYVVEDPVYLKGQYIGSDSVQVADAPYVDDNCRELGYLDYSKEQQKSPRR
jgi:hypothetical protein